MLIFSASGDRSSILAFALGTLDSRKCKVVSLDDVQLVDLDRPSTLLEFEGADEFSAVFVATFEAGFCLFFDLASLCLAASSAFLAAASLSAFFCSRSNFHFSSSSFFSSCSCIMFKHCALVRILAPETLFDAENSLRLGVVLGMYCTRYLDMYFSSLL